MDKVVFEVGQKIIMKKPHPCGENLWDGFQIEMLRLRKKSDASSQNRREGVQGFLGRVIVI